MRFFGRLDFFFLAPPFCFFGFENKSGCFARYIFDGFGKRCRRKTNHLEIGFLACFQVEIERNCFGHKTTRFPAGSIGRETQSR